MIDMLAKYIAQESSRRAAAEEVIIRGLLSRWVSELEPAVAYRDGQIIGLTLAEAEVGSRPWILPV
jgi:hypothetical protein